MWYFSSPQIVHGEGALSHLGTLTGERACDTTFRRAASSATARNSSPIRAAPAS